MLCNPVLYISLYIRFVDLCNHYSIWTISIMFLVVSIEFITTVNEFACICINIRKSGSGTAGQKKSADELDELKC